MTEIEEPHEPRLIVSNKVTYSLLAVFIVAFWWGVLNLAVQAAESIAHQPKCNESQSDITPKERRWCQQLRSRKL